jgi:hypothetical protein
MSDYNKHCYAQNLVQEISYIHKQPSFLPRGCDISFCGLKELSIVSWEYHNGQLTFEVYAGDGIDVIKTNGAEGKEYKITIQGKDFWARSVLIICSLHEPTTVKITVDCDKFWFTCDREQKETI